MKTVNIEGVGVVNFPDDYTPERIKFAIENDILPRQKKRSFEKPNVIESVGRGMVDIGQGVKQLALNVKDSFTAGNEADQYTKDKTEELSLYERGRGKDAGFDWSRMAGNIVGTLPVAAIPGGGAATMLPRVLSGAAQGAAGGAAMFTPEGQSKTAQVALGGAFGAAFPYLAAGTKKAIGGVVEKFRSAPAVYAADIQAQLAAQLKMQGIDYNALTAEVKNSLFDDAVNAVNIGSKLNPEQLARKVDIESIGAKGTRAAITRDPKDWQTMMNLRGINNVGEGIGKRNAEDADAMVSYLQRLRTGNAATKTEAGESVINALKSQDDVLRGGVDRAYGAARDNLGRAAPMDTQGFSTTANLMLDEAMLGGSLPAKARAILNDFASGKVPFNVNTAVQADRVLSQMQRGASVAGDERTAISMVRDALNKAGIADNVGEDAKRMFDAARAQARERFKLHEMVPGMKAAIDDVPPDDFIRKFVLAQPARTIRETVLQLKATAEGKSALADIKGQIVDDLLMKATGATNPEDVLGKAFSGRNFAKALDRIEPEKLHQLFSPSELQALRTLQRASKYLTEEVAFSDVNHSKTAAAMANLLQKIGNTPLLGTLVSPIFGAGKIGSDWLKEGAQRKAAAEILTTSAAQRAAKALPNAIHGAKFAPAGLAAVSQQPNDEYR